MDDWAISSGLSRQAPGPQAEAHGGGAGKTALFFLLLKPKTKRGETRNPFYPLKLTSTISFLSFSTLFRADSDYYFLGLFFTARAESLEDGLT